MKERKLKYKCLKYTPTGTYKAGVIYQDAFCSAFPEYFAPYKFTTNDGVDIYVGDVYWIANGGVYSKTCHSTWQELNSHFEFKRFSTHDLALAHIDEQNKPKFEVGCIIGNIVSEIIFIVTGNSDGSLSGYGFEGGKWNSKIKMLDSKNLFIRNHAEWEAAVIKEAERRGFKEGVKFGSLYGGGHFVFVGFPRINPQGILADHNGTIIFENGKWASIIPEPEKEKTSDEYIEEYWKSQTASFASFLKENNLIITKKP